MGVGTVGMQTRPRRALRIWGLFFGVLIFVNDDDKGDDDDDQSVRQR